LVILGEQLRALKFRKIDTTFEVDNPEIRCTLEKPFEKLRFPRTASSNDDQVRITLVELDSK
jgi:hypothetical protein